MWAREHRDVAPDTPSRGPVFHGDDLAAAHERARTIYGCVIAYTPPSAPDKPQGTLLPDGYGYWSDDSTFTWTWGRRVCAWFDGRSLAAVRRAEKRHYQSNK